ncbi:hypothetical protein [Sphingobacterium sp.]|uniref:hypothetical protein n=1 Tax=Sphingobacterium sp. TaxID=341027 RepID=UPI002FDDCD74
MTTVLMLFSGCLRIVFGPPSAMDSIATDIDQMLTTKFLVNICALSVQHLCIIY